jgi:glycerol-3-phosphate dehydrogenase
MNELKKIPSHYPVVIIGGGITGAGIFRDLSLHQIPTLLIDKKDFSSQTSQSSSKMLHGGIRYLENFDFELVWEALKEKNLWIKLAPHLCYNQRFFIPVFKGDLRPLWMIRIGLALYDILSIFKNQKHDSATPKRTLEAFPQLNPLHLKGSGIYSDAVVDDAKLTLEVIYDALKSRNSRALNYVSLESWKKEKNSHTLTLKDQLTGDCREMTCRHIIFATGPFTDILMKQLGTIKWSPKLIPSRGAHIWLSPNSLEAKQAMVLTPKDGRVIFVIPWHDRILVGTTEDKDIDDPTDIQAKESDIKYLLNNINEYFPKANIQRSDVISSFAGIRPLVKDEDHPGPGKTSRLHKTYQPFHHTHIIIGGKFTTFRVMAQDITQKICHFYEQPYNNEYTERPLRQKSVVSSYNNHDFSLEDVKLILKNEKVRTFDDLLTRRLSIPNENHWKNLKVSIKDIKSLL